MNISNENKLTKTYENINWRKGTQFTALVYRVHRNTESNFAFKAPLLNE
jgi:hypothetical protein